MGDGQTDIESNCPDVTGFSITQLRRIQHPVVAHVVRGLWKEADRAEERSRAGFNSAL
jgi:hypothetical protein